MGGVGGMGLAVEGVVWGESELVHVQDFDGNYAHIMFIRGVSKKY